MIFIKHLSSRLVILNMWAYYPYSYTYVSIIEKPMHVS